MKNARFLRLVLRIGFVQPVLFFGLQASHAGSATWNFNPTSGDWNTAANWTPETVPNGSTDSAVFELSATTDVSASATTQVKSILFNPDASAFTISTSPGADLILSGAGIVNNSPETQNFVVKVGAGLIDFISHASAGDSTFFTSSGIIDFNNSATAASATIVNNGQTESGGPRGATLFFQSSNAGTATLITNSATGSGTSGGTSALTTNLMRLRLQSSTTPAARRASPVRRPQVALSSLQTGVRSNLSLAPTVARPRCRLQLSES